MGNFRLWRVFFLYTFCISIFIEFILLPHVFPCFHAGNGLLNSALDSIGTHKLAVDLVDKIRVQGWSAWQLRPKGQAPIGITSLFYFFILPDPRIFIPLSSALHASAALILVNLLSLFIKHRTKAVICTLPFLLFPSSLLWITQFQKDGFSILGVMLFLQGIVSLFSPENYESRKWLYNNFHAVVLIICGAILMWLVRPYMLVILRPFVQLIFFSLVIFLLIMAFKKKLLWQKALIIPILALLTFYVLMRIETYNFTERVSDLDEKKEVSSSVVTTQPISKKPSAKIKVERQEVIQNCEIESHWKKTSCIPLFIENKAHYLALIRWGYRFTVGKSVIDRDVGFGSIKDILVYLPRAAQIGFLAPFPDQWLGEGSYPVNSLMRKISAFEMIIVYFALIFLPYAIWHWRKRIEIWIILAFCFYMVTIYGLVVCNIGTLYRMRYAYIATFVALGIAGFITFLENLKIKKDISK